jgi:predicted metal-dependent hydrolase
MTAAAVPRYVPDRPLPPYTYVPGRSPHPVSDPRGHGIGKEAGPILLAGPDHWRGCGPYLFGVDLFNHGYYWEAHEAWEGLWHACGRAGPEADFWKGLIQLAVAGVKVREGRPEGVRRHARRAAELLRRSAAALGDAGGRYLGLDLAALTRQALAAAEWPPADPGGPAAAVFDFVLQPG